MSVLLALLANPLLRKIALASLAVLALAIAAAWFVHHERAIGAAKIEAAVKAATEAEQQRESKINDYWGSWAASAVAKADKQRVAINELLRRNAAASAANNGRSCLPADAADRVRGIRRAGG